ncbi:hypothetical protein ACR9E3_27590 [Actinomycetospora sp. C-140]
MPPTEHPARHHRTRRPIGTRPVTDHFTREPAMTTVRTTPARVRTDAAAPTAPVATAPVPAGSGSGTLRALGAGLAVGAAVYGVTFMLFGTAESGTGAFLIDATGIAFQLGVFCLLAAMWRTGATGTTRLARAMIVVESVVLGIATVQSFTTLPSLGGEWGTVATVLDPFWPLSMLGMAVLGIKVAVAGRWRGALRAWPVVAETWVLVAVPSMMIFGQAVGSVVAGVHFLVGYTVLGVLLAVRPELTRR